MAVIEICPSILAADFGNLARDIIMADKGGADQIHLDVMDGHFVPNITFGPPLIKSIRAVSSKPYWAHLMISEPEKYIEAFAQTGVDGLVIHAEVTHDVKGLADMIKAQSVGAGISLNPGTPVEPLMDGLRHFERVLIMTVEPGFGGQSFMHGPLEKIRQIRAHYPEIDIEVDGGIDINTAPLVAEAGANMLVAGSAVFRAPDPVEAMKMIRNAATLALEQ